MSEQPYPDYLTPALVECLACGAKVKSIVWVEHARTHNPSAYKPGWPCKCRPNIPCPVHESARAALTGEAR